MFPSFLRRFLLLLFLCGYTASCDRLKKKDAPAQSPGAVPEIVDEPADAVPPPVPAPLDPNVPELTINKSAQVSVLGYHNFITGTSKEPMQINIGHFRDQMQAIKDAKLPVISMKDFLAWRRGEKDVPDPSVVITIDDGWKSTHTLAMPVLKEFGYPFTVFLYKRFVNGGSKSMSTAEIKELMANGGEVGSHSVSHPYKAKITAMFRKSPEEGEGFLRMEMKDSRQFLEDLLAVKVPTYAYPGGYHSPREQEIGKEAGYEAMFTVNAAKVTWDTPADALPRYIIYGTDMRDVLFKRAISSRGIAEGELAKQLLGGIDGGEPLVTTTPLPDAQIASRRPLIEVDVSKLEGIDPASVEMKIAGFGRVPAEYDPAAGKITCLVKETLRSNECQVFVTFKRKSETKPDIVSWRFFIDLVAHYLPDEPEHLEKAAVVEESVVTPPEEPAPSPAAAPQR
jgi:peptidoglycan/xylan/chitin deacetylase (PgdA/CDA1 family)